MQKREKGTKMKCKRCRKKEGTCEICQFCERCVEKTCKLCGGKGRKCLYCKRREPICWVCSDETLCHSCGAAEATACEFCHKDLTICEWCTESGEFMCKHCGTEATMCAFCGIIAKNPNHMLSCDSLSMHKAEGGGVHIFLSPNNLRICKKLSLRIGYGPPGEFYP